MFIFRDKLSELRVLLVADPQLVGLRDEHPVFGAITRWDCDRSVSQGLAVSGQIFFKVSVLFLLWGA